MNKGDIAIVSFPRHTLKDDIKSFFRGDASLSDILTRKKEKHHITYLNQFGNRSFYELKEGDMFIVEEHWLRHLRVKPLSSHIPNYNYHVFWKENIFKVFSKQQLIRKTRKDKIKNIFC